MRKIFGHLKTVMWHRREVRKLCFKYGLYWQGLTHDLSKYSPTEFWRGVKFFTGKGSPHLGERARYGYSEAWLHHKGRNKHHAEYWQDIRPNGCTEPVIMPPKYFLEMMCDRIAASKIYLKDKYTDRAPLEYYESHKKENNFHQTTKRCLEEHLVFLAEYGEEYYFRWAKRWLTNAKC